MSDPVKHIELEEFLVSFSTGSDGVEKVTGAYCRQLEYYSIGDEKIGAQVVVVPFESVDTDDFKGVLSKVNQSVLDTMNARGVLLKESGDALKEASDKIAALEEQVAQSEKEKAEAPAASDVAAALSADLQASKQRIITLENVHEENVAERGALHDRLEAMQAELDAAMAAITSKDAQIAEHVETNKALIAKAAAEERLKDALKAATEKA